MLDARITLDINQFRALEKALQKLPFEFGTQFLLKTQRDAVKGMRDAAKRTALSKTSSSTLAQSIRTVNGKYAKKAGQAYVVIEHAKKDFITYRNLGSYRIPYKQNYAFTGHLITGDTAPGIREVGKRRRKRKDGSTYISSGSKKSRAFIVVDGAGRWMRRKRINHTGTKGKYYFDEAFDTKRAESEALFAKDIFAKLAEFKKKNGL